MLAVFAALLWLTSFSHADEVRFASVELPPYAGEQLPGGGVTTSIVREAFRSQGIATRVNFYPWLRALALTQHPSAGISGFFPAYQCQPEEGLIASSQLGISVTGFAQRKSHPIEWQSLADLTPYRIGVVSGYVNEAEFDRWLNEGKLTSEPVNFDKNNIRKLLVGRVDAIVIDRFLLEYLFSSDPELAGRRDEVQFNSKPLNQRGLFVCFDDTPQGHELKRQLDSGLEAIDTLSIVEKYIQ
ncbi:substrate-binding periplasmic protein [Bacterioplanes sanyensis]|nr:ABC transporter substrate-binding protein [Bacterioplanes sanyensis]